MHKIQEQNILVVIKCWVYNHEPYLRDCLEGFVMQKTNFRYVAIVHDDCSTDNSADIIREYEAKYPDIFRPIYETENQYSKQDGSLTRIMNRAVENIKCKYVAMCEGDDYWTDPYKLQKQVEFLENHPDYSICFSRVKYLIQKSGDLKDEYIVRDMPGESTIEDLARGNYIHTPSVVFRKNSSMLEKQESLGLCMPGDYVMWMLLAEKGKIWKMEEPMAVYRVGSGIWSSDLTIKSDMAMLMTLNKLWMAIEDANVKTIIQAQIQRQKQSIYEFSARQKRDLDTIMNSKAYRIGKALLAPFKWLKK